MEPIRTRKDLERGLDWLAARDEGLAALRARVEGIAPVPLRVEGGGFAPLAEIVCTQQISRAAAAAIFARLETLVSPLAPERLLVTPDERLRAAGLSRGKVEALKGLARAVGEGALDLDAVARLPEREAKARLCAVPGIGPWTAEVYLLFCGGHPDILPAADVALQWSASDMLARADRLSARELAALGRAWSPWRGAAARLLWANYAVLKGREVVP